MNATYLNTLCILTTLSVTCSNSFKYWKMHLKLTTSLFFASCATYSEMYPKFDLTGVRTNELQIITLHFMPLKRMS